MGKYAKLFLRLSLTFALVCAGFYVLEKYDYITQFSQIDNVLGLLPVIFVILAVGGLIVLLWIKHRERLPVTITLAIFVLLCAALFPTALRGNWWLNAHAPDGTESAPDLTLYAPFKEDTLAAKLDEKSTLVLAENLPVLDGATALYPLYAAFAQAVYDQDAFSDDKVICTNTRAAYQGIIEGKRDIIFVAQPAQSQLDTAKEAGADLVFTPIGKEAFVFL
ncbi:MAG: hypothetical protein FWG82_03480, partial [Oscillospiraceae bacterium]|nr:hypothetical protein [Oscillospiraceae bacterium]